MAKPTQSDAEAAVRVLIEWAGDDPSREGLIDTPSRVARSYRELFAGYADDPREYLKRTFEIPIHYFYHPEMMGGDQGKPN